MTELEELRQRVHALEHVIAHLLMGISGVDDKEVLRAIDADERLFFRREGNPSVYYTIGTERPEDL